jgi:hypothetical protein
VLSAQSSVMLLRARSDMRLRGSSLLFCAHLRRCLPAEQAAMDYAAVIQKLTVDTTGRSPVLKVK